MNPSTTEEIAEHEDAERASAEQDRCDQGSR
jgi:hypothetical protein